MSKIKPELVERMTTLIRDMVTAEDSCGFRGIPNKGTSLIHYDEARNIARALATPATSA